MTQNWSEISAEAIIVARLTGPRPRLDLRRHVARADVVDIGLANAVAAASYVAPLPMTCRVPRAEIRAAGDAGARAVTELLYGEGFDLFDIEGGWGFGRCTHDRSTGWIAIDALIDDTIADSAGASMSMSATISARCAPVFSRPDIKAPVLVELPFGARILGSLQGDFLALPDGGHVHRRHFAPPPATPLAVARGFQGAPYLWGGRTPLGVDCSGLVQAALAACGVAAPRDSDQQRDELGSAVDFDARQGGDLVFFPGHVGILVDRDTLFHANAYWMATVEEPLADVIARGSAVTAVRRLGTPG